jgi:hypothetical protein
MLLLALQRQSLSGMYIALDKRTAFQPQIAVQVLFECSWNDCNRTANQTQTNCTPTWRRLHSNCTWTANWNWITVEMRSVCLEPMEEREAIFILDNTWDLYFLTIKNWPDLFAESSHPSVLWITKRIELFLFVNFDTCSLLEDYLRPLPLT